VFSFILGEERYIFAVFDGHGGNQVAEYVRDHYVDILKHNSNYLSGKYEDALKESFEEIDTKIRGKEGDKIMQKYIKENKEEDQFQAYSDMAVKENLAFSCG